MFEVLPGSSVLPGALYAYRLESFYQQQDLLSVLSPDQDESRCLVLNSSLP